MAAAAGEEGTTGEAKRLHITVLGIVQGVGFRPFVYGLAQRLALAGIVRNDAAGVTIEIEGAPEQVNAFVTGLRTEAPPLAVMERIAVAEVPPRGGCGFTIVESDPGAEKQAFVSPDVCTCGACRAELFNPANRRYRYPFINCTNCGPRYTIIQDVPYDRSLTTMRAFPMCAECRAEYGNPLDRRFHAQPNACPRCGPQLRFFGSGERGAPLQEGDDALREAQQWLRDGKILAVKGLGGYHLACDATNAEAVAQLRARKHREDKPFALMAVDEVTVRVYCLVSAEEAALLTSRQRPIVLLQRGEPLANGAHPLAEGIAPGIEELGWMLPYTPLHFLLLDGMPPLVMTSGNLSEEPIAYHDEDALARLSGIADGFLTHNRDIFMRCDDSVMRSAATGSDEASSPGLPRSAQFLRRSRGYAPQPLGMAWTFPKPLLAVGSHLKNTFCLGKGQYAYPGAHIGDLENLETLTSFREGIAHYQRLFDIEPEAVVYDLHPGYLATQYALESGIGEKIGVQHHHAHIASVLAEHGVRGQVIGIAADGTGYGTDGAVWGGEILIADLRDFERVAHLKYAPMPGGEQAIRQPWRMGAVYLWQAYGEAFTALDIPFTQQEGFGARWRPLEQMVARNLNSPPTSSMGRLFDGVAALLGIREQARYEGQAAIELEMAARRGAPVAQSELYPFGFDGATIDSAPMIRALAAELQQGADVAQLARRFHLSIAKMLVESAERARAQSGLERVALSGGVFQNRLLLEETLARLKARGFQVLINRRVPTNDGGVSLGQAAIGAARLRV